METFQYTFHAQQVVFGPGAAGRLGELGERFGWRRLLLLASAGARARGQLAPLEAALGPRLVATYERVQPHVPEASVAEATTLAVEHDVDAVIGYGGGSAIGIAKAVSFALEARHVGRPAGASVVTEQPLIPVIALPTTYAGSEMTPVYGVTHPAEGQGGAPRKITVSDPKVAPKLVLYDPLLTLDMPPRVTGGTGINAVAHCIEALYSITRNPLSTAAALAGLRTITPALPRCHVNGHDLEARGAMLEGAFLAGTALSNVAMGLHHGLCHVIGGTTGAAHGDANSVLLPYVMRFNLDSTAPQLASAAEAMGSAADGQSAEAAAEAAIERVTDLIKGMGLPQRLRDIGVAEAQLPVLAALAFENRTVRNNPKPLTSAGEIETLLREAY